MKTVKNIVIVLLCFTSFVFAQDIRSEIKIFEQSITEEQNANYGKAIKLIENIYLKYENEYLINLRLGWLNHQAKKYVKSIKYYKTAIKLSDGSVEALLGITYPLAELKKWDELMDAYEEILDNDPNNYAATKQLGIIHFNGKNYLKSKGYFEDLVVIYPSDYFANIYLGWNYFNLGNKSKAKDYFLTVLLYSPNDDSAKEGLKLTE